MSKFVRLIKFLLIFIPVTMLNGIRMIVFEDVCVNEILFEVSKPRKDSRKISRSVKKKIVREYLNDCLRNSPD